MAEEINHSIVPYEFNGKHYEAHMFSTEAQNLPGVLIAHTWLGIDQSILSRAQKIAELGYVAFIVDLFGPGVLPDPPVSSMQAITPFIKDREYFRRALIAGLDVFKTQPSVNPMKMAAVGYCFGGCGILELARSGAQLEGVVSLHGELNTSLPAQRGEIKARILVLHGDSDTIVKKETIDNFFAEMKECGATWEFTHYSNAKHSFTGEGSGGKDSPDAGFQLIAENRSWQSMTAFLRDIFGDK